MVEARQGEAERQEQRPPLQPRLPAQRAGPKLPRRFVPGRSGQERAGLPHQRRIVDDRRNRPRHDAPPGRRIAEAGQIAPDGEPEGFAAPDPGRLQPGPRRLVRHGVQEGRIQPVQLALVELRRRARDLREVGEIGKLGEPGHRPDGFS